MKKIYLLITLVVGTLILTACGKAAENVISIVATQTPHSLILEEARPHLQAKGYELDITVVSDFTFGNPAVALGSYRANFFQHTPFLNQFNAGSDVLLSAIAHVHIEPLTAYSRTITSFEQLNSNSRILVSTSIPDRGRLLYVLYSYGIIGLREGANRLSATFEDIIEIESFGINVSNFIEPVAPQMLVPTFLAESDIDIAFINGNFALSTNLLENNPQVRRILVESTVDNPFANVLVVRDEDKGASWALALAAILESDTIRSFILERFGGYVVPAN